MLDLSLNGDLTPIERAQRLAAERGIKTQAKTLRGLVKALRGSHPKPNRAPSTRYWRSISPADFVQKLDGWEGRARARTIGHTPLLLVLEAALRREYVAEDGEAVPNSYRYPAEASVAWAKAEGQAVLVAYGRTYARTTSFGHGTTPAHRVDAKWFLFRHELLSALALPDGYRWAVDQLGPCIIGPGFEDYHPTARELSKVLEEGPKALRRLVRTAMINAQRRGVGSSLKLHELREYGEVLVDLEDAQAAGYCEAGTRAFAGQHGLNPDAPVSVSELLDSAGHDARVLRVASLAVKAARFGAAEA